MSNLDDVRREADRLISKAEKAVEKHSVEFESGLEDRILSLRAATQSENYSEASQIAYRLKGAAGSFGWPMISIAAGFMRHVLEEQDKINNPEKVIIVHLETIELIFSKKLKGRTKEGIDLIQQLNTILDKFEIKPGV